MTYGFPDCGCCSLPWALVAVTEGAGTDPREYDPPREGNLFDAPATELLVVGLAVEVCTWGCDNDLLPLFTGALRSLVLGLRDGICTSLADVVGAL